MDANKAMETPVPTVDLGGRIWILKVTHRVLERFSAISQVPMSDFDAVLMRYDMMTLLLWLMLCETRQDLTKEGLNGWLNALPPFEAMKLVSESVSKAVEYSFPKAKEAPEEDDKAEPGDPTAADI